MSGAALHADLVVERGGFRLDAAVDLAAGEIAAIMGPSGAGKSTLLAAIAGDVQVTAGEVAVGAKVVSAAGVHVSADRRGIALLGQDPRLFPHLDARDNIAFGLRVRGIDRRRARVEAQEWLTRVGVPDGALRRPAELSGGQQQRVAIARALAVDPRVLLLDEPFTSLDPETADGIRTLLHEQLAATRATAIIVTHDAVDAVVLASRLLVIENGGVTQAGTVRDVLLAPETAFAATLTGLNRVVGVASGGRWISDETDAPVVLTARPGAQHVRDGDRIAAVFPPAAVRVTSVSSDAPPDATAPAPNRWRAHVVRLEQTLSGVRIHTGPVPVAADVPIDAVEGIAVGDEVAIEVDPAAVRLLPSST